MMIKVKRQALFSGLTGVQTRWRLGLFIFLLIGFFAADFFPNELNVSKIQAWIPAGGLALIIGVMFGWKSWIFVFLTSLLTHFIQGNPVFGSFGLVHQGLLIAALTILPYYIMRRLRVDIFLSSTIDLIYFIFTAIFTSIIVSGLQLYALNREIGLILVNYWTYGLYFGLQTLIGILSIYPFAMIMIGQVEESFIKPGGPRKITFTHFEKNNHPLWFSMIEFGFALTILISIIILIFNVPSLKLLNSYYLVFLPLIWLALRFSRFGALTGVFIATAGIMTAVRGDRPSLLDILSMQLFLFIQISITLLTGHFISERKRIIDKLKKEEQRFRAVANTVPAGVFQINNSGEITYLTSRWFEITGFSLDETFGKQILSFVHPDDRDHLKDQLALVSQQGGFSSQQFRLGQTGPDVHLGPM